MRYSAVLFCLFVTAKLAATEERPQTVILSFGGLSRELLYAHKVLLPNLFALFDKSAVAKYMAPVFPSKTPVNHFSIATGLYAKDHGVMEDCRFDEPGTDCTYEQYTLIEDINPIWTENQDNGGNSAVFMWPGSDKKYKKGSPNHYKKFDRYYDIDTCVAKLISWMQDINRPANLVMAYFGALDEILHTYPVISNESISELGRIDRTVKLFLSKLEEINLKDQINLIILGTQGICTANYYGGIELETILKDYIDELYPCKITAMGANAIVTPRQDQFDRVHQTLKDNAEKNGVILYKVYLRDEIPEHLNLKDLLVLEDKIFLVANIGYFFWNFYLNHTAVGSQNQKGSDDDQILFETGFDGYPSDDNNYECMQSFFMANGPDFVPGPADAFRTIDIYPLLRKLLGLKKIASSRQKYKEMEPSVERLLKPQKSTFLQKNKKIALSIFRSIKSSDDKKEVFDL